MDVPVPPAAWTPLQRKRLEQIQGVSLVLIVVAGCVSQITGERHAEFALVAVALSLVLAYALARMGRFHLATSLTLGSLTALAFGLMWEDKGVRDPAILGYPGILVFAAILGSRRLFKWLLVFMVGSVGFLVLAEIKGWFVPGLEALGLGDFVDLTAILLAAGFGIWIMAQDVRSSMARLEEEMQRVVQSQAHINFLANYDQLTGFPNHALGRERFQLALAQAARGGRKVALIHLDVDNFKTINDSLGHAAGDQMLLEAGARVKGVLQPGDTLCRQGGDEFLAVVPDLESVDEAAAAAERILGAMVAPFRLKDLDAPMSVSLGIALFPEDGGDFETLLQGADTAMHQAKALGKNTYRFADSDRNAEMLEHLRLGSARRTALERNELFLHYQPQFDLATGRVVGAEALLRWRHPELGLVPPGTFIPIAEKSGQIGEIGKWALRESCRQARRWLDSGIRMVLSVNLSPVQFHREDLEATLLNALDDAALPPATIELELTESMLLGNSPNLSAKLGRLRALGVGISIDDFGTGYSNLSYLQRFEVERLKIDQSFVRRLVHGARDEALVVTIIQMAKNLGLGTVAEGIEDEPTRERLMELGCDMGQGFLWSPAISAEAFEAFFRAHQG
jgi:diguanylate cyclase (GGDEF)-like protein